MSKQNNSNSSMSIYAEYLIFICCILFTIFVYVINTETSKLLSETINLANELANRYQAQNFEKAKDNFGKDNFKKENRNTSSSINLTSLVRAFLPKVGGLLNLPDEKKSIRDFITWYYQNINTSITRFVPTNITNANTNINVNANNNYARNKDASNVDEMTSEELKLPLVQKLDLYSHYISLKLFYWKNEFIILGIISVFLVIDALIANYLRGYLELKPRIICFVMSRRAVLIWGSLIPISICIVNTTTLNTRVMDCLTIGTAVGLASYFYYLPVWSKNK